MKKTITYVRLDVHKETIAVSVAEGGGGHVGYFGMIANQPGVVWKNITSALCVPRRRFRGHARLRLGSSLDWRTSQTGAYRDTPWRTHIARLGW